MNWLRKVAHVLIFTDSLDTRSEKKSESIFAKEGAPKGGSNMLFFESSPQAQRLR